MDGARNTVMLTSSWVTLGMKKRDSQGHVFLFGQFLQLADQNGQIEKLSQTTLDSLFFEWTIEPMRM